VRPPPPPAIDPAAPDEAALKAWADELERVMSLLCRGLAEGQWRLFTTGEADMLEALDDARVAIYGDTDVLDALCTVRRATADGWTASDLALGRRLAMLHREFLREAVASDPAISAASTDLAGRMSRFRAKLGGAPTADAALMQILATDPDRARREAAWRARCAPAPDYAADICSLRDMRNEQARCRGYRDFYELGLTVRGLQADQLTALVSSLLEHTQPAWRAICDDLAERVGTTQLMPWDLGLGDPQSDDLRRFDAAHARDRALRTFSAMGLPLEAVTLDLDAREGKSEHAWCVPVDPPTDIRVTATLADGLSGDNTLLHELGHAAHSAYVTGEHFVLRDAPNDAFHEGLAQLFAYLAYNPHWLCWTAGLSEAEAARLAARGRRKKLLSMRWWIVWIRLEQALFSTPQRDVTEAFWSICEDVLGITADAELREIPAWARVVHLATHPVYIQNYVIADVVAAQLDDALRKRFGRWFETPAAGAHLRDSVIAPGALLEVDELLVRASGRALDAEPYAVVLSGA